MPSGDSDPSAAPTVLRFCCGHCGMMLETPLEFAGVSAPCPTCGEEVHAPDLPPAPEVPRPPTVTAKIRTGGVVDFPWENPAGFAWEEPRKPSAPVPESDWQVEEPAAARPATAPAEEVIWDPVAAAAGVENFLSPSPKRPRFPTGVTTRLPANDRPAWLPDDDAPLPAPRPDEAVLSESEEDWDDVEDGPPPEDDLLPETSPVPLRKRDRILRLFDAALLMAFIGTAALAGAAFTFSSDRTPGTPIPQLTETVAERMQQVEERRLRAGQEAAQVIRLFASAPHVREMENYLLPRSGDPPPLPFPCFPGRAPEDFALIDTRRIPDSNPDRFLTIFELPSAISLSADGVTSTSIPAIIPVEQISPGVSRIHGLALDQQLNSRFARFLATTEGSGVFYTQIRPCPPAQAEAFARTSQDLKDWIAVEVQSAFPMITPQTFMAFMDPASPAAGILRRRAHDSRLLPAVITLTWRNHIESGPFIELVRFEPNAWSRHMVEE